MQVSDFRGTKDFSLEISYDRFGWTVLVEDTLADLWTVDKCSMPKMEFDVITHGRYVKFTAKNYYGYGSGLNYIGFRYMK